MSPIRIATWNVNSIKVRLPHLLQWIDLHQKNGTPIDAVGLQELKLTTDKFPFEEIEKAGYLALAAGQKTYNGVAILVRKESLTSLTQDSETAFLDHQVNLPNFDDEQQRLIVATLPFKESLPIRFICGYFPNGQAPESEKFEYKLNWLRSLEEYLNSQLPTYSRLVLAGDFNIAPHDDDVHDPSAWIGKNLVSPQERAYFEKFSTMGLIDSFRLFEHPPKTFSWWDYRMMGFRRNHGLRIDHILVSQALKENCLACTIDREPRTWEQPSDHAPVILTIKR